MGLRGACRIPGQPEIAFDFLRKKYLSMSFSPALIYDFLFLAIFSFAAVKSWQKGFLAGLTELVGAVLGVGVAVWGSRTLAPEVYTRFFSDSVTARVNEAVAQSGGDIAAALQQLDFLPESLRNAAANALQTAGDQLPEKLTALLEDKEKTLLLRLINAENEIGSTMALENFILGFRLGVRMILEALDEDDGSLLDPNKEE